MVSQTKVRWGLILHWGRGYLGKQKQCECQWELPQFNVSSPSPFPKTMVSWGKQNLLEGRSSVLPPQIASLRWFNPTQIPMAVVPLCSSPLRPAQLCHTAAATLPPFSFPQSGILGSPSPSFSTKPQKLQLREWGKEQLVAAAGWAPSDWPGIFFLKRPRQKWQTSLFIDPILFLLKLHTALPAVMGVVLKKQHKKAPPPCLWLGNRSTRSGKR